LGEVGFQSSSSHQSHCVDSAVAVSVALIL
jgi:hypothetical protein